MEITCANKDVKDEEISHGAIIFQRALPPRETRGYYRVYI